MKEVQYFNHYKIRIFFFTLTELKEFNEEIIFKETFKLDRRITKSKIISNKIQGIKLKEKVKQNINLCNVQS